MLQRNNPANTSSSMASDRAPQRSSLIQYLEVVHRRDLLHPIYPNTEFNLNGENHHMNHFFPPERGHKYVSLLYPDPSYVNDILLKKVKGPSVLYLRGCAQLMLFRGRHFPFQKFKTLTILEISGIDNLTALPEEISEMNQLQTLTLSHLPIQHFPTDDFFSKLTNLCSLVLKACPNLLSLPKFSNLTTLVTLDLSHLLIEELPDEFFSNMKKLHKLILRGCSKLHSLPSIKPLKSLKFLDISYTILDCTTDPLASNPTLTHVFARYAKGSLCDYLVHQKQIEVLDLSGAHNLRGAFQLRKSLPPHHLVGSLQWRKSLPHLIALDISRTSIESIDFSPSPPFLQILLIRNCSSLVQLSAMRNLGSLKVLDMSGSESLCVLPEDLCKLVMLKELNLSGCTGLTELREGVFDKMNRLEKLDLSKTNFKHLPSFSKLISLRTRLILPRGLVLQVPELSSDIESKNLVIVEDDVASPDLESEDEEGSIPNEFHLVSTFTNTYSSFYRFKHEFTQVKDRILDIQSKIEANSIVPKGCGMILVDLEYILENIDLLESADHKGNARKLLDRLMEGVDPLKPNNFISLKELLCLVVKLKLLLPCPKQEDFESKEMNDVGNDSNEDHVSRLYVDLPLSECQKLLNSYNSLTAAQRNCLLCLSIFTRKPYGVWIKKRILFHLWYGEGFIDDARHEQNVALSSRASSSTNTNHVMISSEDTFEEIGRRIMLILEEMKFFMLTENSEICFMDHGVHCFVREKAKEEGFIDLDDQNRKLTPQLSSGSKRACLLNSRYSSPSSCQLWLNCANTCQKVECFKSIRTLFNVNERFIDLRVNWFSKMRNLFVLHLGTWASEKNKYIEIVDLNFLEESKNMKQLRVLSFEGVGGIRKLPDSVCQLAHLKILNLRECSQMEEIPDGIGSLQNLSHLDVTNCPLLSMFPKGIKLLSKLEVLKGFLISYGVDGHQNKKACTFTDLVKLEKLRKLNLVVNLAKFPSSEDLQVFKGMKNLYNLKITWLLSHYIHQETKDVVRRKASRQSRWQHLKCWEQQTPQNEETEEPIRSSCCLEKLKKLVLCCFPLETAPEWLHPTKLHNLEKLYIIGGHLKAISGDPIHNTWNVKNLHLSCTLKLDMDWERLRQIFPNITYLQKLPHKSLSTFHVHLKGELRIDNDQCRTVTK